MLRHKTIQAAFSKSKNSFQLIFRRLKQSFDYKTIIESVQTADAVIFCCSMNQQNPVPPARVYPTCNQRRMVLIFLTIMFLLVGFILTSAGVWAKETLLPVPPPPPEDATVLKQMKEFAACFWPCFVVYLTIIRPSASWVIDYQRGYGLLVGYNIQPSSGSNMQSERSIDNRPLVGFY